MADLLGQAPGAWQWDVRQDLVDVDDAMRVMLGEPLNGRALRFEALCQSIHPDDLAAFRTALQALVSGARESTVLHCRLLTRWGEVRAVRLHGRVQDRDPAGTALRVAGLLSLEPAPPGTDG